MELISRRHRSRKQFLRKKANRIYTLRTDSHKMHQEVLLATKNHSLEFLPSRKAYYGSTVIVTYDGALSACPFTINWNVNAVVFVTNGGTKVALALLSFDNNTTGPPANWSHKNLSELPDRLELLVASSVT
jgi:hypothetical protein